MRLLKNTHLTYVTNHKENTMYQIEIGHDRESVLNTYASYQDKTKTAIDALETSGGDPATVAKYKAMYTQVCVGIEEVKPLDNLALLAAAVNMLVQFERVVTHALSKATLPVVTNRDPDLNRGNVNIVVHPIAGIGTGAAHDFRDPTISDEMNAMLGEPLPPPLGASAKVINLMNRHREQTDDLEAAQRVDKAFTTIEVRRLDGDLMNPIRVAKILFSDAIGIVDPGFYSIVYDENGETVRTAVTADDRCMLEKVLLDALTMKEEGKKVHYVIQRDPNATGQN
jgi:hypothetical protein